MTFTTRLLISLALAATISYGQDLKTEDIPLATKVATNEVDNTAMTVGGPKLTKEVNNVFLGDFIVNRRQELLSREKAEINFTNLPVATVVRLLAEASNINYVMPKISNSERVDLNVKMNAFQALEKIAENFGMGVYEEQIGEYSMFFIRKKDKEVLVPVVYQLENIHLGKSGGGNASDGFGSGSTFEDKEDTETNTNTNTSNRNLNSLYSDPILNEKEDTKGGPGSEVLTSIRKILGIAEDNSMQAEDGKIIRNNNTGLDKKQKTTSFVSYNGEQNTIYVLAAKRQHEWVKEYLDSVDKSFDNIAIEGLFLESEANPSERFGIKWDAANGTEVTALSPSGSGISVTKPEGYSAINPATGNAFATFGILNSENFKVKLNSIIGEQKGKVSRVPKVVTVSNQEVILRTTLDVPISAISNAVSTDTNSSNSSSNSSTSNTNSNSVQTNQDLGVQSIGTTLKIRPQEINKVMVLLNITLEISTGATASNASNTTSSNSSSSETTNYGEGSSGRLSTNSTVYRGKVKVPSGYTLAIGGLERIADKSNIQRVPYLSKIPVFGFFFKNKEKDFSKTNITLFITPTIITDSMMLRNGSKRDTNPLKGPDTEYLKKLEERGQEAEKE